MKSCEKIYGEKTACTSCTHTHIMSGYRFNGPHPRRTNCCTRAQRPLEHALFSLVRAFSFFLFMINSIFFFTCNNWQRRRALPRYSYSILSITSLYHRKSPWRPIIAKIPQFVRVLPTWWHCAAERSTYIIFLTNIWKNTGT